MEEEKLEEYIQFFKKKDEKLKEIVLDKNEDIVDTIEDMHENLKEKYNVEIDEYGGTTEYTPPFKDYNPDYKTNERIYLPIAEAKMIVKGDKDLDELTGNLEERAKRQVKHNKEVPED